MPKKTMVAMILAGGKGTRLESLTRKNAKPAVFYGGKYRIIDFVLSNVANSNINSVGILTQYESIGLNTYIGNGSKWGIDGNRSLTSILPPRQTEGGLSWYRGTADAIYQNLDWLENINPEYVLILFGDHIYRCNFNEMLEIHKKNKADVTIAALEVTLEEARRFGILSVDENDRITEFAEKPKNPKSTLASMGIYIFNYRLLRDSLKADAKEDTDHDFGKNIIPSLLKNNKRLFIYRFEGYWKDVGTIQSLWEANMDLLKNPCPIDLFDPSLKVFSEDTHSKPQYIGPNAKVTSSLVNQGATILGNVNNSVIFNDVTIEEGAEVDSSVIMPGTIIRDGTHLSNVIVSDELDIKEDHLATKEHVELISK